MKKRRIIWQDHKVADIVGIKRQIADAYLSSLLKKGHFSKHEKILLHKFTLSVQRLVPLFEKNKEMVTNLQDMLQTISDSKPQHSNILFYGNYVISYYGNVKGSKIMKISEKSIKKLPSTMRVSRGIERIASRSLGLLVGELSQYLVKQILSNVRISGKKVMHVKQFTPTHRGKRVDDWLLVMSGKTEIPVEVKASTNTSYFKSAFSQLKNALKKYKQVLFVGMKFDQRNQTKNIGVILFNRRMNRKDFNSKINKTFSYV